ncbi:NRDE family protein [Nonomuraea longicatena]|uniref:NRDE family protein n=1 Tax=Nonomuraea longicatena TaxID=83682 RepID=A0ABP3ZEP4_9ACTN
MCTVIVKTGDPLRLMGVRDEFTGRPWEKPGEHWPAYPGVTGGRDLLAGGTWLAVRAEDRRAAALLNGRGHPAPEHSRRSRGDLPLRAVVEGGLPDVELPRYDPFHLVLADPDGALMWSWDGRRLRRTTLPEGTSVIVNSGLDLGDPRVRAQRPLFAGSDDWWALTRATQSADPGALIMRQDLPDGRVFASLSVTLVTISADGVATEFDDVSGRIGSQA